MCIIGTLSIELAVGFSCNVCSVTPTAQLDELALLVSYYVTAYNIYVRLTEITQICHQQRVLRAPEVHSRVCMWYGVGDSTSTAGSGLNGGNWKLKGCTFFFKICPIPIEGNLLRCWGLSGSSLAPLLGGLPLESVELDQSVVEGLFLGWGLTIRTGGLGMVAFFKYELSGWKADTWRGGESAPLVSLYHGDGGDSLLGSLLAEVQEWAPRDDGGRAGVLTAFGRSLELSFWGGWVSGWGCVGCAVFGNMGWISKYSSEEEVMQPLRPK